MGQSSLAKAKRKAAVLKLQVNCVRGGKQRGEGGVGCRCGKYLSSYIRSEAASSLEMLHRSEMNNDGAKSSSSGGTPLIMRIVLLKCGCARSAGDEEKR